MILKGLLLFKREISNLFFFLFTSKSPLEIILGVSFLRFNKLPYVEYHPDKFLLIIYEQEEIGNNLFTKTLSFVGDPWAPKTNGPRAPFFFLIPMFWIFWAYANPVKVKVSFY